MGRSTSINNSTAIDNRLAVTDNGFGLSSSGTANNTALRGSIFNLSNSGGAPAGKGQTPSGGGGSITVNTLDGGVIDKAFDFSAFSLSAMLDSVISGQKVQQQSAQYTANAIGSAVRDAAAASAAGNAYTASALQGLGQAQTETAVLTAAQSEVERAEKMALYKKLAIGAVVLGAGWYYFKGKK